MMNIDAFRSVAVRAWTQSTTAKPKPRRRRREAPAVHHVLVFDTETTIDATQALLYGAFRYCRVDATTVTTVAEGLIYADDLPERDPEGYRRLERYAASHKADVDLTYLAVEPLWDFKSSRAPSSSTAGCGMSATRTTTVATQPPWSRSTHRSTCPGSRSTWPRRAQTSSAGSRHPLAGQGWPSGILAAAVGDQSARLETRHQEVPEARTRRPRLRWSHSRSAHPRVRVDRSESQPRLRVPRVPCRRQSQRT